MNEKFIVIDTETTNSLDDPIVYDVGFAVVDCAGTIYEKHSYIIAEIFLDSALMEFAYFKDKIPAYWKDIREGKRIMRRFKTVKMIFADVCRQYGITKVFAHNARFDYRSLNLTQRWLTSSKFRYFFPYGIEIWDTLKMSRKIFGQMPEYDNFCWEHDYLTKRLAKRYTAEIIYRFISGNNEFEESHTGLEDVLIEKEIARYCFAKEPDIDGALWSKRA